MKRIAVAIMGLCAAVCALAQGWIRVNHLGYLPESKKVAVLISPEQLTVNEFEVVDASTGETIDTLRTVREAPPYAPMQSAYRLDFSDITSKGVYLLRAGGIVSPPVRVSARAYHGTADFLLNYMRQQRCGYNPFVGDSCHRHDGYIVYHPAKTGQHLDVTGGWHDAADYLQYTTTSANAIYQMMLAYEANPESFGDNMAAADGEMRHNGTPEIIEEIKWGMDWLCKMNPSPGEYYNQIADDRDHASIDVPQNDFIDYGYGPGLGRPVYYCSGEPQQRGEGLNATEGVASTVGKFSSCFALGSRVLADFYPEYAEDLARRAVDAYETGAARPGVCQTASIVSPYIYEEGNWVDDMELAAAELYRSSGDRRYLERAVEYGRQEPVTPWMGADTARHYQWYPFINVGHYRLASLGDEPVSQEFVGNMRQGIQQVWEKAQDSPFLHGIPYIWCSNNLTVAMLTQCRLYRELTGDDQYLEMEMSLLDWLFGTNPWGTSMVCELPLYSDHPQQPHSAYIYVKAGLPVGGLVDGPVYRSIFESLRGVDLTGVDWLPSQTYDQEQPTRMVYHDVLHDYSTNEPTMDGTASLTYILGAMQADGQKQLEAAGAVSHPQEHDLKPRLVVLTDIGPADVEPDDNESAVRLLSYADRYEIEALITTIGWNCDPYPAEWADYLYSVIDAYEKDLPNLAQRSEQTTFLSLAQENGQQELGYWPTVRYLRGRTMMGSARAGIGVIGEGNDSPGSDFIIQLADEDDLRPIYVCAWGGANTLAQAIWKVRQTRTPQELRAFLGKLRLYTITDQDMQWSMRQDRAYSSHQWLRREFPEDLMLVWDESAWLNHNELGKADWANYATKIQGRGHLGHVYPTYLWGVEGDTPSYLNCMPHGLNDPDDPTQAGWGGYHVFSLSPDSITDAWTNWHQPVKDISDGYERRFYPDAFNDFAARMEWAATGRGNRNPLVSVNGNRGYKPLVIYAEPGSDVRLDASASYDPDGDEITYSWWQQPEHTQGILDRTDAAYVTVTVPAEASSPIHVICEVRDDGPWQLVAYKRIILMPASEQPITKSH